MPRLLLPAFLFALGGLGAACTSPCMQIQQTLCICQGQTQIERTNCEDAASAQESLSTPTPAQETQCQGLVDSCTALIGPNGEGCDKLQTLAGRQACGIAPAK